MPKVTRAFLKTGLIYFLVALVFGIVQQINAVSLPILRPLFWHALMVGWITQIIFGVSLWMFPGRPRDEGFRPHLKGWLTYIFLNVGLILRFIAEPMLNNISQRIWNILVLSSALLQLAGGLTYVLELWPRVQSKKQRLRNRKKNRNR